MNIEQLITEARDRQIARTNAYRTEQEERAYAAANQLEIAFNAAFGAGLFAELEAIAHSSIDTPAHILFTYQMRDYSLRLHMYDGMYDWRLTRLDPRADDDERRLPTTSFTETRRDIQANIDALVLALYDLDQEPGVSWPVAHVEPSAPVVSAPVVSAQGVALLEAIRSFVMSEVF